MSPALVFEQQYDSCVAEKYVFPDELREAQRRLHEAQAAYARHCATLPWSAVPAEGWKAGEQQFSGYRREVPATEGYTPEQRVEDERLRALVLELSLKVMCHLFWSTFRAEDRVDARQALKQITRLAVAESGGEDGDHDRGVEGPPTAAA